MKTGHAVPKFPELNAIRDDLNRLKFLWIATCVSPLLYLILARFIAQNLFNSPEQSGWLNLSSDVYRMMILAGVLVVLGVQIGMIWVRRRYAKRLRMVGRHINTLFKLYTKRTFVLMALSECATLVGFILFLVNGDLWPVFAFGLVGLVFYGQSYPSECGLGALTKML